MKFKKIGVCHGKVCGVRAQEIQNALQNAYQHQNIDIYERTCCGRCEHAHSIVVDDSVIISDLSIKNIHEFIADPDGAIACAQKEEKESEKKLNSFLSDNIPS
jgi:NADH:ubiquinone oxidoreductase subunit E